MTGADFDPRTPEGIAHVARLARLELSAEDARGLAVHMGQLLDAVDALQALEPERDLLAPTAAHALRADAPGPSLPPAEALQNAPEQAGDGFVVPAVLSES